MDLSRRTFSFLRTNRIPTTYAFDEPSSNPYAALLGNYSHQDSNGTFKHSSARPGHSDHHTPTWTPKQRLQSAIDRFTRGEIPAAQFHYYVGAELDRAEFDQDIINGILNDLEYAIHMFDDDRRAKEILYVLHEALARIEDAPKMNHLVIYPDNLSSRELRTLEPMFGRTERPTGVLPLVSPPLDDEHLSSALPKFCDFGFASIQPAESHVPQMTLDEALGLVQAHSSWAKLLQVFHTRTEKVSIRSKEFPRCWLILAQAAPVGMPPGGGYVVDKCSREVLPHRYIDVADHLNVFDEPGES